MRGLLLVAATVALFAAGCGQFGKPTAGRDLSEAVDRLSAIQDDFAAQDPEAMATEEIPTFLRRLAARYRALADDVGTVVISERSRRSSGPGTRSTSSPRGGPTISPSSPTI
jgi:hypothetical protein